MIPLKRDCLEIVSLLLQLVNEIFLCFWQKNHHFKEEIDLLIRCIRQNNSTLSLCKRESWFSMLSDDEIKRIEKVMTD